MAEICVKIPEEMKKEIEDIGLDPSIVLRAILKTKLSEIARLREIVSRSKLTQNDVDELSEKIDIALSKRFNESLKKK